MPEFILTPLDAVSVFFRSRSDLALAILTLRQRVAVLKAKPAAPEAQSIRPARLDHPAPHLAPLGRRLRHREARDDHRGGSIAASYVRRTSDSARITGRNARFVAIRILGSMEASVYDKKANPSAGGEIRWKFTKFLVDRNGKVIDCFGSSVVSESAELISALERTRR